MIIIYSQNSTPRFLYILKLIFTTILGVNFKVTNDINEYNNVLGPKLNYSEMVLDGINIKPATLLFETNIHVFEPTIIMSNSIPCIFPIKDSDMPFDLFAASFYMVSRYEEYHEQPLDNHGRILATESLAYRKHFLEMPVVDHWAYSLKAKILEKYPNFSFPSRYFKHIPTIDIDIAFAFKYHGIIRTVGGIIKRFLHGDFADIKSRLNTLIFNKKDPYDVFDLLQEWYKKFDLAPVIFFLVGNYGPYDRNINPKHPGMTKLLRRINGLFPIGVHPSYASNSDFILLQKEVQSLSSITESKVTRSRQHFLKHKMPETYQNLINCDIKEDFTMGYATVPGFRAGTCTPYQFYNLREETETALKIYPFQLMDDNFIKYMSISPEAAIKKITEIQQQIRQVDGTLISLWHNVSLSETGQWKNWQGVYLKMLEVTH